MGTLTFDFLVDSFLFKDSLIQEKFEGILEQDILAELTLYRQFCIDHLDELQQEIQRNNTLRIFSGMEMPTPKLLKQSAFYVGQYIIDDPIFKFTHPSRDADKAFNKMLKVEEQGIDRHLLSHAVAYMKSLTPMVVADYIKFIPVSYLFERPKEIPILHSDCGFSDSIPESLISFFSEHAIIKSVDIVGSDKGSRFINLNDPEPCREIMIQFKNHIATGHGYILYETLSLKESEMPEHYNWSMHLPDKPPDLALFEAWVNQSFYLSSNDVYQNVLKKNTFATELDAYYLSESQFVFDLLGQFFPLEGKNIEETTANILMNLDLPFLERIEISTLMNIRMEYGDEFQNFRLNLEKHLRDLRLVKTPEELKIKADNALHELCEVQVHQINQRLKQIRRTALIEDSIILLGSLIGTVQTGHWTIPALAGIAATATRGLKPFLEYDNQIRQNSAFFIWKVLDESQKVK
jgi:hypothetical protein